MRLKTITKRAVAGIVSAAALIGLAAAPALAASTFSDNLWQFDSGQVSAVIDFNRGGSGVLETGGNLRITTDDTLFIDAPLSTYIQRDVFVGRNLTVSGTSVNFAAGDRK